MDVDTVVALDQSPEELPHVPDIPIPSTGPTEVEDGNEDLGVDLDDDVHEDIYPLYFNYQADDKRAAYKNALFQYGTEIVAKLCTRRSDQWELFSHIEPGIILFSFSNHQRLVFTRRGDKLNYRFRRNKLNQRSYSFRCLWLIQSPVFQETMTQTCPLIDRGQIYLTHTQDTDTYNIRLSWGDVPFVPEGDVLTQSLVEYNFEHRVPRVPRVTSQLAQLAEDA